MSIQYAAAALLVKERETKILKDLAVINEARGQVEGNIFGIPPEYVHMALKRY